MEDAFFLDGDLVERTSVRDEGDTTADTDLAEQVPDAVCAADFFVGGDGDPERGARVLAQCIAEDFEDDGDGAFHIAGAGADDPAVDDLAAVGGVLGVGDDVDVATHEDVGGVVATGIC